MASTIVLTIINIVALIYMLIVEIKKPKQNAGLRYWLAGHFVRLFGVLVIVFSEISNNYYSWINLIYLGFAVQILGLVILNESVYKFTNKKSKIKYLNYLVPIFLLIIGLIFRLKDLFIVLTSLLMVIYFIIHVIILNYKTNKDIKDDYIMYSLLQIVVTLGLTLYVIFKVVINLNDLEVLITYQGSNTLLKSFTLLATFNTIVAHMSLKTMPVYKELCKQRIFNFMVEYTNTINLILDIDKELIYYANNEIANMLGYDRGEDLINKKLDIIFENEEDCNSVSNTISSKESFRTNLNLKKKNNEIINFDIAFRRVKIKDKRYCFVNFNETQIDQNKYKIMAYHDELTNLPNRRKIIEVFEEKRVLNEDFYLVIIDIDNFKTFNDSYGHQFGDKVLKYVGSKLLTLYKFNNLVGRYGGDEFVLLISPNNRAIGDVLIEIIKIFKNEVKIDNKLVSIDFSLGFSKYPTDGKDLEELFEKADKNLYADKKNNKA